MHARYTIDPGPPPNTPTSLGTVVYEPPPNTSTSLGTVVHEPPPSNTSAPPDWLGTPMEMVADAFRMDSPWRHAGRNDAAHKRKMQARRDKRNKAARKARRRNRR